MDQKIKIGLGILVGILLTLTITYFVGKNEEDKKLAMLGITKEQAQDIRNSFSNEPQKVDKADNSKITEKEKDFFENNNITTDEDGYYFVKDYYYMLGQPTKDFTKVFFKKEGGKWYWSVYNKVNWALINGDEYKNPNSSLYNGYKMRGDNNKAILKELLGFNS